MKRSFSARVPTRGLPEHNAVTSMAKEWSFADFVRYFAADKYNLATLDFVCICEVFALSARLLGEIKRHTNGNPSRS
jgi:hypothetical protein